MFATILATVLSLQAAEHCDHRCCCQVQPETYLFRVDVGANESGCMTRGSFTPLSGVPRRECQHARRLHR
jgi:hypothetical protein